MIYIYYSATQRSFLKREAQTIIKNNLDNPNEFNLTKFDATENSIKEILDACYTIPFYENKKVVIVDDAYFLAEDIVKDNLNSSNDFDALAKYFKKSQNDVHLVFLVYSDKLNTKGKLYKALPQGVLITPFLLLKEYDWEKYVNQIVAKRKINIERSAIKELAKRTLNDRDRLLNEVDKLSLYTNRISLDDVFTLVSEPLEDSVFSLANFLFKGEIGNALFVYRDLLLKEYDLNVLLAVLANQFRFYFQVYYMHENGKSLTDITTELKAHEYRIKMAYQNSQLIKNRFSILFDAIYNLDLKIKSGHTDRYILFELFLTNFQRNFLS